MRTRPHLLVPALAASVFLAAYGAREVRTQDPMSIDDVRSGYEAAFNAGDATELAALYEQDAVYLPDHAPMLDGRTAIQEYYAEQFGQYTGRLTITAIDTDISGDDAHEYGTYSVTLTPSAGGEAITENGKYLVILRRQADGSWKLHHNVGNTNTPPPGTPTP